MSETDLDRLAAGGFVALAKDLLAKADQGDRSATDSLGWLARRCELLRSEEQLDSYRQTQLLNARVLPPPDAEWFAALLNQDIDADRQHVSECAVIDQDHVRALLEALSAQGDGASTFLLAEMASHAGETNRLSRLAAVQGFPQAEFEWALDLMNPRGKDFWTPEAGDPTPLDFLRQAAGALPVALGSLALCEYSGCEGSRPDPDQAVTDARAAARQGETEAMLDLAREAPPSLLSPTEAQAWRLFEQALNLQGCHIGTLGVDWMKSVAALSAHATPASRALFEQNWQAYGARAMRAQGC